MFEVFFYRDRRGKEPIMEYLQELATRSDKDSRIKLQKIRDHVAYLRRLGPYVAEPYAKHLEGEIWELRPLRDRILFAAIDEERFILLHLFVKKSQKTPRQEIEQAKRNLDDYRKRNDPKGANENEREHDQSAGH